MLVLVLVLSLVLSFGWLSTAWIDWLPSSLRVPAVIAVGVVALVLRGMKSEALSRELDAQDAAREAARAPSPLAKAAGPRPRDEV